MPHTVLVIVTGNPAPLGQTAGGTGRGHLSSGDWLQGVPVPVMRTVKDREPSASLRAFLGADVEGGAEMRRKRPPEARAGSQERQPESSAALGMETGLLPVVRMGWHMGSCCQGTVQSR